MQRIHKLLSSPKPLKWLFYGDSITHGAFHTFGARDYTELFSERIRGEMTRAQDIVIKTALSGIPPAFYWPTSIGASRRCDPILFLS